MILCILALVGCGQTATSNNETVDHDSNNSFKVELQISGLVDGHCYLGGLFGEQYYTLDSFSIDQNGHVSLTRPELLQQGLYYAILPNRQATIQFLVSEDQDFSLKTKIGDLINSMEVSGSLDNELLYQNLKFEQKYRREYQEIRQRQGTVEEGSNEAETLERERKAKLEERKAHIAEFARDYPDAFFTKFKLAGQNPVIKEPKLPSGELDEAMQIYLYRKEYWNGLDFSDGRLLRTPVYHSKLKEYMESLVPQRVDSLIKYADYVTRLSMQNDSLFKYTANFIGIKYKEPTFMGADAVFVHMVKNFFTHELAFWADEYEIRHLQQDANIRDLSLPGRIGQNILVTGLDGKQFTLHDIKATIIVLYIYTTECDNCRKETPKVLKVYHEWKNRGVEVLALCTDREETVWKDYVKAGELDWKNAYDPSNPSDYTYKWHVDITPEIYVMNSDFEIIAKDLKAFQLPEVFSRQLAK